VAVVNGKRQLFFSCVVDLYFWLSADSAGVVLGFKHLLVIVWGYPKYLD